MLREILWLDSGDTIIRGTGKQIQCNYVTPNQTLFFFNYFFTIMESLTGVKTGQLPNVMFLYNICTWL